MLLLQVLRKRLAKWRDRFRKLNRTRSHGFKIRRMEEAHRRSLQVRMISACAFNITVPRHIMSFHSVSFFPHAFVPCVVPFRRNKSPSLSARNGWRQQRPPLGLPFLKCPQEEIMPTSTSRIRRETLGANTTARATDCLDVHDSQVLMHLLHSFLLS